ncbi:MAG: hypothetical protein A2Y33_13590 [Spirochaetes bacterium GWF1_51_8]|nr:MAG: hypothetical protein A2Y33_13590 [Spirochaetes bacterium GWF1_51_8]
MRGIFAGIVCLTVIVASCAKYVKKEWPFDETGFYLKVSIDNESFRCYIFKDKLIVYPLAVDDLFLLVTGREIFRIDSKNKIAYDITAKYYNVSDANSYFVYFNGINEKISKMNAKLETLKIQSETSILANSLGIHQYSVILSDTEKVSIFFDRSDTTMHIYNYVNALTWDLARAWVQEKLYYHSYYGILSSSKKISGFLPEYHISSFSEIRLSNEFFSLEGYKILE